MGEHSLRCPQCGYDAILPFTDNCPLCGTPVRGVGGGTSPLSSLATGTIVGLIAILALCWWLHGRHWGWLLLTAGPACAAWWFLCSAEARPLVRALAATYLGLMVLGLWVASRTEILPGLGAYNPASFEDMIEDLVRLAQGGSPQAILMARRFRSCLLVLFIVYPLVVVPPFLLVPPLLRRHRRLALVPLRPQTCWGGLALWAAVLALWGGLFLPGQLQRLATPSPVNPMLRPPFQLPHEEDGPEEP